jgi:hypothetical protein
MTLACCLVCFQFVEIGRVASIEFNHKPVDIARAGMEVCIKIMPSGGEAPKMYGRHFDAEDLLVSKVRPSRAPFEERRLRLREIWGQYAQVGVHFFSAGLPVLS